MREQCKGSLEKPGAMEHYCSVPRRAYPPFSFICHFFVLVFFTIFVLVFVIVILQVFVIIFVLAFVFDLHRAEQSLEICTALFAKKYIYQPCV